MKANEFVKLRGISYCKELLIKADGCAAIQAREDNSRVSVEDLKRLVESHELVERLGGLKKLKSWVVSEKQRLPISSLFHQNTTPEWRNIEIAERAIADVESCQ